MLIGDVRPKTLEGVKSLATQLRKEQGIKYSDALDRAALAAGCANFRSARRMLPARGRAQGRPYVLLTVYWRDAKQRDACGRETLKISLSRPILDICSKSAFKRVRGWGRFRMVADDHFVADELAASQADARKGICAAERSLRFMERTGLQPCCKYQTAYSKELMKDKLPNQDHPTNWVDPSSGQLILVDEPYGDAPDEAARAAWAARTGWKIVKTSWPGMYNPYNCDLYVATDCRSGYGLDALVATINAIPPPMLEEDWSGESSQSWETFLSPKAVTAQDARRAKCRGTVIPVATRTSVPYSYRLGESRRRPAAKLGIEGHISTGRIIKTILASEHCPHGVYARLNALRSDIEDWMALEIDRNQLTGPEFFSVYYRDAGNKVLNGDKNKHFYELILLLGELKGKLTAAYPNCIPLRRQISRIDVAISLIERAKVKIS